MAYAGRPSYAISEWSVQLMRSTKCRIIKRAVQKLMNKVLVVPMAALLGGCSCSFPPIERIPLRDYLSDCDERREQIRVSYEEISTGFDHTVYIAPFGIRRLDGRGVYIDVVVVGKNEDYVGRLFSDGNRITRAQAIADDLHMMLFMHPQFDIEGRQIRKVTPPEPGKLVQPSRYNPQLHTFADLDGEYHYVIVPIPVNYTPLCRDVNRVRIRLREGIQRSLERSTQSRFSILSGTRTVVDSMWYETQLNHRQFIIESR